jgi:CRP-like cAMP-binding protein
LPPTGNAGFYAGSGFQRARLQRLRRPGLRRLRRGNGQRPRPHRCLITLAGQYRRYGLPSRGPVVALTHEQIAALAGTSRETATKVLGDLADRGLIRLGRGRIILLDIGKISTETGDQK